MADRLISRAVIRCLIIQYLPPKLAKKHARTNSSVAYDIDGMPRPYLRTLMPSAQISEISQCRRITARKVGKSFSLIGRAGCRRGYLSSASLWKGNDRNRVKARLSRVLNILLSRIRSKRTKVPTHPAARWPSQSEGSPKVHSPSFLPALFACGLALRLQSPGRLGLGTARPRPDSRQDNHQ